MKSETGKRSIVEEIIEEAEVAAKREFREKAVEVLVKIWRRKRDIRAEKNQLENALMKLNEDVVKVAMAYEQGDNATIDGLDHRF